MKVILSGQIIFLSRGVFVHFVSFFPILSWGEIYVAAKHWLPQVDGVRFFALWSCIAVLLFMPSLGITTELLVFYGRV